MTNPKGTPGYPYMDGPQSMDWPNAPESTEAVPAGMGGMNWPNPGEGSMPTQEHAIEDMTPFQAQMNTAQQNCRDALRGSMAGPMPVDPDGDND